MSGSRIIRPIQVVLALAAFLWVVGSNANSLAEPNKVQYELEERCGNQARAIFEKDWKGESVITIEDGQIIANFENHYNPNLNKCFYLLTSTTYKTKTPHPMSFVSFILLDVNENRDIGEFVEGQRADRPISCFVADVTCHSKEEWKILVEPYMGR